MDGRRLRLALLTGCLFAGALGCSRKEVRSPMEPAFPQGGPPGAGVPMTTAKKPFWERSPAPPAAAPAEVVAEAPKKKGPLSADTQVQFADVRLEAALDEKTPPTNKESLLDAARQGYQKALQQDPKSRPAMLGLARYYSRTGERERSVEWYKKYLTANPTDKDVAHEVATAHARWKDWPGAVAWCQFTLKMDPENLAVRKTMAFCLARDGKWEPAFQVMCEVMPEAQARYLMARVLEHQNQPEACRTQLQLALKADPRFADAQEFLAELDGVTMPGLGREPDNGLRTVEYQDEK
jgi:tetratricopeptide (TPR) repeat protein